MKTRKLKSIYLLLFFIALAMSASVNAQSMRTIINNLLPTSDPYCVTGSDLLDGVAEADKARLCPRIPASGTITAPSHVVDWVVVELRAINHGGTAGSTDAGNASTALARKPAFLLSNGRVVDAELYAALDTSAQDPADCTALTQNNNCPDVEFEDIAMMNVDDVDLYLVIRHRNHLDIISSTHLTEESGEAGVYAYDFSTGISQARLDKLKAKSGTFAMVGGDVDGNGSVTVTDYSARGVGIGNQLGSRRYNAADADFGGVVTTRDYAGVVSGNLGTIGRLP